MFYSAELDYFRLVLKNLHIHSSIVVEGQSSDDEIDIGLRDFLEMTENYNQLFDEPWKNIKENTIYKLIDIFNCCYIFMLLPETEKKSVLIAGPYTNKEITYQNLVQIAEKHSVPPVIFSQIEKYFSNITVVKDERYIMAFCNSLAEVMWKGSNNFAVETVTNFMNEAVINESIDTFKLKADDPMLSVRILEERYAAENRMIQAVSQGNVHTVEQLFSNASNLVFERRTPDPVRNMKNYLIISNTLFRKAAEYGAVHPFYIDGISTDFAKRIEMVGTVADAGELMRKMVKKYCKLVKTHSMRNYSPFVQKVMTLIDSDLTADLSLKRFADILSVNPSYLSALFKKETGKTLTEYVAQKRIEHAAYLLRTTNLQIQTVAQHCGIYDVNYFAKIFKKIIGKTPKEYRNDC